MHDLISQEQFDSDKVIIIILTLKIFACLQRSRVNAFILNNICTDKSRLYYFESNRRLRFLKYIPLIFFGGGGGLGDVGCSKESKPKPKSPSGEGSFKSA